MVWQQYTMWLNMVDCFVKSSISHMNRKPGLYDHHSVTKNHFAENYMLNAAALPGFPSEDGGFWQILDSGSGRFLCVKLQKLFAIYFVVLKIGTLGLH